MILYRSAEIAVWHEIPASRIKSIAWGLERRKSAGLAKPLIVLIALEAAQSLSATEPKALYSSEC